MALARGFWLRLPVPTRFGACELRAASAAAGVSCNVLDIAPWALVGVAFDSDTFGTRAGGCGSLVGVVASEVRAVVEARRRAAAAAAGAAARLAAGEDESVRRSAGSTGRREGMFVGLEGELESRWCRLEVEVKLLEEASRRRKQTDQSEART